MAATTMKVTCPVSSSMYPVNMRITRSEFLRGVSVQMADFLKLVPFMKNEGRERGSRHRKERHGHQG